jgi:hypothetical protein
MTKRIRVALGITLDRVVITRMEQYAKDEHLTKSAAVERILCKEFGIDLTEDPRTEMLLAQKDAEIEQLRAELEAARNQVVSRRPLDDLEPDGYLESDKDYVLNNIEVCTTLLDKVANSVLYEDRFTLEKG